MNRGMNLIFLSKKMLVSQKIATIQLSIASEKEKHAIFAEMYKLSDDFRGYVLPGRIVALEANGNFAYYIVDKVGPTYCDLIWIPSKNISPFVINDRCLTLIVQQSLKQSDYFRSIIDEI